MFHVLLFEPEIPPNTGNIIRLCANTGASLHLLGPLGFDIDAAAVRRAGLDYADMAHVTRHASLQACLAALSQPRLFAVETGSSRRYSEARFAAGDALLFGAESCGLPASLIAGVPAQQRLSIPMRAGNRSLNLSNAVALVLYEAWRQLDFGAAGQA